MKKATLGPPVFTLQPRLPAQLCFVLRRRISFTRSAVYTRFASSLGLCRTSSITPALIANTQTTTETAVRKVFIARPYYTKENLQAGSPRQMARFCAARTAWSTARHAPESLPLRPMRRANARPQGTAICSPPKANRANTAQPTALIRPNAS